MRASALRLRAPLASPLRRTLARSAPSTRNNRQLLSALPEKMRQALAATAQPLRAYVRHRLAQSRDAQPYARGLRRGVPMGDEALLWRATCAMLLARAVYLPEMMMRRRDTVDMQVPGLPDRLKFRIIAFQPATGTAFRYNRAPNCHICDTRFILANVRETFLSLANLSGVSSSAAYRYHCHLCYRSVCSSCCKRHGGRLVCKTCETEGAPPPTCEVQYAIMRVPQQRALVLAFRGTTTMTDLVIDGKTRPDNLLQLSAATSEENSAKAATAPTLLVHGGVLEQLNVVYDRIKAQLLTELAKGENHDMQLHLSGHSLGGAYATVLALRFMLDPDVAPHLLRHDFEVFTFGAPRCVFDLSRSNAGLQAIIPEPMRPSQAELDAVAAAAAAASVANTTTGEERSNIVNPRGDDHDHRQHHHNKSDENQHAADSTAAPLTPTARSASPLALSSLLSRNRADQAVAAHLRQHAASFYEQRFHNFVNETDIVPRLLGNAMTGMGLASATLKHLASSVLDVHLEPADVEDALHHYRQLGRVYALVSGQPCLHIPTGPATDMFFAVSPFGIREALDCHRTALYEARLIAAYEAAHHNRKQVQPTPATAVTSDPEFEEAEAETEARESFGTYAAMAAADAVAAAAAYYGGSMPSKS